MEDGDDDGEDKHIHEYVDIVKETGVIVGEIATSEVVVGEGEEMMMDVAKEFILEERAMGPTDEGIYPGGDGDDRGDISTTQILSIDTLLGDIYKL